MGLFGRTSAAPDVEALTKGGDAGGLVRALKFKKDAAVRRAAAEALGGVLDFKKCFQWTDLEICMIGLQNVEPQKRRAFIAEHLLAMNEKDPARANKALASALGDADPEVRANAARAIGRIWCSQQTVKSFLYSYERWFPPDQFLGISYSISAARSGAPILDALIRGLQDAADKVRIAAAEALAAAREKPAIPALSAAAEKDPNPEVREAAGRALASLDANRG
jgi:HEAT repeat protein